MKQQTMTTSPTFPKIFRFRATGRARVIVPLILLLGLTFLTLAGALLRFILMHTNSWPLLLAMLCIDLLLLFVRYMVF